MYNESEIERISDLLQEYAIALMGVGTHTSRVVHNVTRIALTFGYNADMTIFQKSIMMTISLANNPLIKHTSVKHIKPLALNFRTISDLSALSWNVYDNNLTTDEFKSRFDQIMSTPQMSRWAVLFLVGCANASFCRLFGGDIQAMTIVFIATIIGFFTRQELTRKHFNHLFIFVICAFVASMIGATAVKFGLGATPQIALGSSVLFLIPGVPLINSVIDIIEGHVLAGSSRLINASILIICIALGLLATLLILGIDKL